MEGFQKVYPFTTESISGYITQMDIKNKKVLTVGSSCDQALNSLLLGAKDVTIFDINKQVKEFYEFKKNILLNSNREEFIDKLIKENYFESSEDLFSANSLKKMNLYLSNDNNYKKLQLILLEKNINFITGNIFNTDDYNNIKQKYDRVILSNVLDYLPIEQNDIYNLYEELSKHLNRDSIIQLYYLYNSNYPKNFSKTINSFLEHNILLEKSSCNNNDSVIFVKKK